MHPGTVRACSLLADKSEHVVAGPTRICVTSRPATPVRHSIIYSACLQCWAAMSWGCGTQRLHVQVLACFSLRESSGLAQLMPAGSAVRQLLSSRVL